MSEPSATLPHDPGQAQPTWAQPTWAGPTWAGPNWAETAEARVLAAAVRLCGRAADRLTWGDRLVAQAAREAGLSPADSELLLPGGPRDLAALLSRRHDAATIQRLAGVDPRALKVRQRIRLAVETRIEAALADEAAVRRCSLYLARPDSSPLAMRLAWESADGLWRWAGDTATDENHYSKRAILAGLLVSTLAIRLASGPARAESYLAARIDGVMRFETWKAALPRPSDGLSRLAGALGRLRYGAPERP